MRVDVAALLGLTLFAGGTAHAGTLLAPDFNWQGPKYNSSSPPSDAVYG